jgi:hypothetical protein
MDRSPTSTTGRSVTGGADDDEDGIGVDASSPLAARALSTDTADVLSAAVDTLSADAV